MSQPIDWTTTAGCPICWEHGPFRSDTIVGALAEVARGVHQTLHEAAVVIMPAVAAVATFASLTREDFTLAAPTDGSTAQ